jgi:hypothetical protein
MNCPTWPDGCTGRFEESLWPCRFGQNPCLRKSALVNSQPTVSFFFGSNKLWSKIPLEGNLKPMVSAISVILCGADQVQRLDKDAV